MPEQDGAICAPFSVKSPFPGEDFREVAISANNERMRQLAGTRRPVQLFEAYYNVCGLVPNVNNIGYHEQDIRFQDNWGGIRRAHVIFKGIKRPCKNSGNDEDIFVYVTKPKFRYRYEPGMVCVAKRVEAPDNVLFVALVSFPPGQDVGEVLNWEWVETDPDGSQKPIGYADRYDQEVWNNG